MMRSRFRDSRRPFLQMEKAVLDMGLRTTEIAIYCVLAARANERDQCWPAYDTIAAQLGLDRRTAMRAVKTLRQMGLLKVTTTYDRGRRRRSNLYELVDVPPGNIPTTSPGHGDTHVTTDGDIHVTGMVTPMSPPWCHQTHCNENTKNENTKNEKERQTASQSPAMRDDLKSAPISGEGEDDHEQSAGDGKSRDGSTSLTRKRSLAQRIGDEDRADVRRYWRDRFVDDPADHAWAGMVIQQCRRLDISPLWLIDQVPIGHLNPRARLMGYLTQKYPVPETADHERRRFSFHAWDTRPRHDTDTGSIRSIADVLAGMTSQKTGQKVMGT